MIELQSFEVWLVTGSQHLYGEAALKVVAEDSRAIAAGLVRSGKLPVKVVFKPVVTTPEAIQNVCLEANNTPACVGLIAWMHTFSPAKMWIAGLKTLHKPLVHLHTQFSAELPWSSIDMNFMNLHQSAHGDREFGFIGSRMRLNRKVIVGHWQDEDVLAQLTNWMRAACAWNDMQSMRIARFGDNMRDVAVTEGDKVAAQIQFGYSVYGYGVGELVKSMESITDASVDKLVSEYNDTYLVDAKLQKSGAQHQALCEAARIELGLKTFLEQGRFSAFTTTFEDLHGLTQLPGLAVQRLMGAGYGFGAEGDWKTASLVRSMKVMGSGLKGGTSFMEDYTYDLSGKAPRVLGAHMLEVCESIASGKPSLEIHPLSIGGKSDPPRLVFNVAAGNAINATVLDMGNRFRMVVNPVEVVEPEKPLGKLPVARVVWIPQPDLKKAAGAWILAGGAHHTGFSQSVNAEMLADFAEMADLEFLLIDNETKLDSFKKELRWNDVFYMMKSNAL
jgi:L-arabinose isomerase